jgi:hypothetical protein
MRIVLVTLVCWATLGLAPSQASVDYRYVAEQSNYTAIIGTLVEVKLFLQETVTAGSTSLIADDLGLFGAAVVVTRINTGNAAIFGSSKVLNDFKIAPNVAPSPVGFGPSPTQVSQAPATSSQSGLVINADVLGAGSDGPNFATNTPGVRKILLGTLNITVGSKTTSFVVSDYGPTNATVTQKGADLDATTPSHIGAADPVGGPFVFRVVGIPEPSSMALCGLIGCGLSYAGYRRRKGQPSPAQGTPA